MISCIATYPGIVLVKIMDEERTYAKINLPDANYNKNLFDSSIHDDCRFL
jgi:hypothetical protein